MSIGGYSLAPGELRSRNDDGRATPFAAPDGSLKVSPTVAQIVDRVRTRFGVALEVVNSSLQPVVPESGGELLRAVEMSARTRAAVTAAMHAGRSRTLDVGEMSFLIQPLRGGRSSRAAVGLLAIRQPGAGEGTAGPTDEAERWVDFLRIAIEADLSTSEGLREERLQARRTLAALRFLGQLASIQSESELARAVVHAAAVWFDVDARLYRRDLAGDLVLHTHLPGIPDAPASGRLSSLLLDDSPGRFNATAEVEGLGWAVPEALLVPIPVDGAVGWVLALGGVVTAEAQIVFETVGKTMGSHLTRLAVAHRAALRARFEEIATRPGRPSELVVLDVLRQMMEDTGAASGVITLLGPEGSRRLAFVGTPPLFDPEASDSLFAVEQVVYRLPVGDRGRVVVALAPPRDGAFREHASVIVREAASVLHVFLSGITGRMATRDTELVPQPAQQVPAFVERITEELERAKRFDLGLSMLLIDLVSRNVDGDTLRHVVEAVRQELRGSDVLGFVGEGRIAALLVHTDGAGVGVVVARVRQRLERLLHGKELPAVRLGRGVFSHDCTTASDLLTRASQDTVALVAN